MAPVNKVLCYIYQGYPNPVSLGVSRVMKMIFLADWYSAVETGAIISDVTWHHSDRGPFSPRVVDALLQDKANFNIEYEGDPAENIRTLSFIVIPQKNAMPNIEFEGQTIKPLLDNIIHNTHRLPLWQLQDMVQAEFPMRVTEQGETIPLMSFAREYNKIKHSPKQIEDYVNYHKLRAIASKSIQNTATSTHTASFSHAVERKQAIIARLKKADP